VDVGNARIGDAPLKFTGRPALGIWLTVAKGEKKISKIYKTGDSPVVTDPTHATVSPEKDCENSIPYYSRCLT